MAIYVLAAVIAAFASIEAPVRNASIPQLVGTNYLPPALALNQIVGQLTALAGPALAGVLLASLGVTAVYVTAVAGFAIALASIFRVRPLPPAGGGATSGGWAAVREGLAFARSTPVLLSTFVIDLNAMVFGMPRALFPALAVTTYHVGPDGLGLMYAAAGAGALLGAAASGWVGGVRRQGLAVIVSVVAWGAAIVAFGLVPRDWFPLALVLLAAAGWANVVLAVFRNTILQLVAPDAMRPCRRFTSPSSRRARGWGRRGRSGRRGDLGADLGRLGRARLHRRRRDHARGGPVLAAGAAA